MDTHFAAPWSTALKIISWGVTVLFLGITWGVPLPEEAPPAVHFAVRVLPSLLLIGCACFTVRGYEVRDGHLLVRRLGWSNRIPLARLAGAELRRGPFGWAWRTFGNGGLFSFSGWFYQKPLGAFRALATKTTDAVILTFSDRKPLVVTPDNPERFVQAVREAAGLH